MLDKEKVGKMIALQRKATDLTQKDLADLLHISYQAVSKWELGISLPTVEMLYDIAKVLNVTVDYLLNADEIDNRDICYKDVGLDTAKLYEIKAQIDDIVTKDPDLVFHHYVEPVFFRLDRRSHNGLSDTNHDMDESVCAMVTNVPGSKEGFARERGYDREICADVVARSINMLIKYGIKPKLLQAHIICGSNEEKQLMNMAHAFKSTCEKNDIIFSGMEISAQPVNYLPNEYEMFVSLFGEGKHSQLIDGKKVSEGDVLIALKTDGIESSSFPFIRVMLDRNPELAYAKIDEDQYFLDEILKPNRIYTKEVNALCEHGYAHEIIRISNSFLHYNYYKRFPDGLGACINLSSIKVDKVFQFMINLDMMGKKFFPYRFSLGVGLIVVVPKEHAQEALKLIQKTNEAFIIGTVKKAPDMDCKHKVWTEGRIKW